MEAGVCHFFNTAKMINCLGMGFGKFGDSALIGSLSGADPGWKVTVAVILAKLGGSGGMPPRKIFEIWSPETPFPAFWAAYFLLKFEPKSPNFRWKNNEKQTKTTKHFNNYDTSFSTPLVQHQNSNTIISLTSRRATFTVFINREFKIYDAAGSTTRSEFQLKMNAKQFHYCNKCLTIFK
jgi:hypothetical protein